MDEKLLYYIWLSNTFRAGSPVPKLLLTNFKSITEIYHAEKKDYAQLGISSSDTLKLCNKDLSQAKAHLDFCKTNKVGILCYHEPHYPERLKIIDNPPPMFYYRGRLNYLDDYPCITMVGTRSCSERGFRLAYKTAFDAASKGAAIVNGLALGIDGACIAGALDANGYCIGVLGCGIDRVYPYGNKELFDRLCACGLILSEFPPFTEPEGKNFPVRNRCISGLSVATCIFEADASSSGAMITAEHAINQGRRIFAVPGKPYDKTYSGPLELIKNGATVFTQADDFLSEYSMSFPHRINLENKNPAPEDKLEKLINQYFKKGNDPDEPVNRRHVKKSTTSKDNVKSASKVTQNSTRHPGYSSSNEKPIEAEQLKVQQVQNVKETSNNSNSNSSSDYDLELNMLTNEELTVFEIIKSMGTATADEISAQGLKIEEVLSIITLLEIYEHVEALPGGRYKIKNK